MSFGSFLSNGLTATANTVGAYQGAEQKASQDKMQQAIQQMMVQRQQAQADLAAQLTRSTIGKNNAQAAAAAKDITGHITGQDGTEYNIHSDGSLSPATMRGATAPTAPTVDVPPSSDEDSTGGGVGAGSVPQQPATPQAPKFGPKPKEPSTIPGTPAWEAAEKKKAQIGAQYGYHAPPGNVVVTGVGADGKPTIFSGKNRGDLNLQDTGVNKPVSAAAGALAAPVAFRVGQAGEMLKKAADILPMLDQLRVGLSQSSAADIANSGVGIAGMHIPGTKGVGNMMMNNDPRFATYQAALGPLVIAAAHANAGLRVSDAQMAKIQKNMEVQPGDVANPTVMAMKKKNVVDLMNSIVGSLPADAVAAQEAQMDPATLAMLRAAGYRGAQHAAGPSGPVNLGAPQATPADIAHAKADPAYAAFLRQQGLIP